MKTFSPRPTEAARKRAFYRQPLVVAGYERQRFGGASGAWVNEREISAVLTMLPSAGRVLDLGCGTGRLGQRLVAGGYDVVLLDASDAMLARAVPIVGAPAVLADAFALPFAAESFDAVAGLRLAFHFAGIAQLIESVGRVLRPGGRFVFDTYRWSPRAIVALAGKKWGGKVHVHSAPVVEAAANRTGLRIATHESCFLFSPYVYRLLPVQVVHTLSLAEQYLPAAIRLRDFWCLEKPSGKTPLSPLGEGQSAGVPSASVRRDAR
jgi:SAM-dependent methyltransferase